MPSAGAREMKAGGLLGGHPGLQFLRALAAGPGNLGLLLSTDTVLTICNSLFQELTPSCGLHGY